MRTSSTATIRTKRRWEWAQAVLEVASIVAGIVATVGLWFEGWREFGPRLVFGGVAVEVFAAIWILAASRKLQNILEEELEGVRLEAARAIERAEEIKRGLVEAERNLEQERTARLKIEAQLAPRRLTGQQEALIERWLSSYKDAPLKSTTMIDVAVYTSDNEASFLARQLWSAFGKSGCKTTFVGLDKLARVPIGILVEYQSDPHDTQWRNIAAGIVNALRHVDLLVPPAEPMTLERFDSPISVTVGRR